MLKAFSFRKWWTAFLEDAAAMNYLEGTVYDALDPLDPTDPTVDTGEWDIMDNDRRIDDLTDEELWDEAMGGLLESLLIVGLTLLLGILLIWRRAREENAQRLRRRQEEERQMQERAGDAGGVGIDPNQRLAAGEAQDARGMFPDRNDPEFLNWAVGGIGH